MPLEYLSELSVQTLPLTVEDTSAIDKLRVLRAANLVVARLPDAGSEAMGAEVLAITSEGRAELRRASGRRTLPL